MIYRIALAIIIAATVVTAVIAALTCIFSHAIKRDSIEDLFIVEQDEDGRYHYYDRHEDGSKCQEVEL